LSTKIGTVLELPDRAAKNRSGRVIPLHEDLRTALAAWRPVAQLAGPVIVSERGGSMTPQSIVVWFANAYRLIGLDAVVLPIREGEHSLPALPASPITPVARCATFNCWQAIGRSKQRSGTSTATPTYLYRADKLLRKPDEVPVHGDGFD
jgi:integrase